ncbi:MAG: hypothetical protein ACYDH5_09615 [Acidimicrobiales bacterium]
MALSTEDRDCFLASLRTDAAFREEVRREVLSEELLGLPQRFAAFVDEMRSFVDEMRSFAEETRSFVESGKWRFDALEDDVVRLTEDFGTLRAMVFEQKIRSNPGYCLRRHARRVKVVDPDDFLDDLGFADSSDDEYELLARGDVLARGASKMTGAPVIFMVEATWRVHTGDVDQQVCRRQVLQNRGAATVAIIASIEPPGKPIL